MAAWRWDKTSQPCLKSPVKEELSVVKMLGNQLLNPVLQGQAMLACGTKKGKVLIYQLSSGRLLAEVENAHYLAVSDLDVSSASGTVGS